MPEAASKTCSICGEDCTHKPRTKDARGRYFCKTCYDKAAASHRVAGPPAPPVADPNQVKVEAVAQPTQMSAKAAKYRDDPSDAGQYGLEEVAPKRTGHSPFTSPPPAPIPAAKPRAAADAKPSSRATTDLSANVHAAAGRCPSCEQSLPPGTIICVPCGIRIDNGRSILTAEQGNTERLHDRTREVFWFLSWIFWMGLYPVSSEAHGSFKPWAIRGLALFTVVTSAAVWFLDWTDSPSMRSAKNLMMWVGDQEPDPEQLDMIYELTSWGDRKAYQRKKYELRATIPEYELPLVAHAQLPKSRQALSEFQWWQTLTCAFLHGGFLHLGGNLLFMIVFGSRINALIGNVGTLILYPILAVLSAVPEIWLMSDMPPTPTLGASGAIMGLAGMYLMLFPVSPMHVVAFIRVPILLLGIFKCRGFWILLFFFGMDVVMTLLQADDGVAHWAHMSGFMFGMLIGAILLMTRGVNARGNDLISTILGKHAWGLIGKPVQWRERDEPEGWMTRLRVIPAGAFAGDDAESTEHAMGSAADERR